MNKLLKILVNPYLLSVVFSCVIIALLPPVFDKFKLELIFSSAQNEDYEMIYSDLNFDGYSEQILSGRDYNGTTFIQVRDLNSKVIDQWNFDFEHIPMPGRVFISDIFNDGTKEIFRFTRSNDSIFLNCISPFDRPTIVFQNRFICKINFCNGIYDFSISPAEFCDLNQDLMKEFIFAINAGYALFPRRVFAFDLINDTVFTSNECGNFIELLTACDINNDEVPELLTKTWAPNNYIDTSLRVTFTDTTSLFIVFDNTLKPLFEPIAFNYSPGQIQTLPIEKDGKKYMLTFNEVIGSTKTEKSTICIWGVDGQLQDKKELPELTSKTFGRYGKMFIEEGRIIIPSTIGDVFVFNFELNHIETIKLPNIDIVNPKFKQFDLNKDGKNEFIFFNKASTKLLVSDRYLQHINSIDLPNGKPLIVSLIENGNERTQLFIKAAKNYFILEYYDNTLFYWHYPIYFSIFIIILALNLLIQKIQKEQIRKSYETKQTITELQLKTIRNQMEPHFTFNAINSIASVFYDGDKELAYQYFTKISRLIRATLDDAEKITRSLNDEVEFVTNYLEIQKFRFPEKFEFKINIEEPTDLSTHIPKMIIQIYAENAVKHGLVHKTGKGLLKIDIGITNKFLVIKVEDDGIGRKKAQEIGSKSSGKGHQIMQQYYSLFNSKTKYKIKHQIIDKVDANGNETGTKVIISIPLI